MMPSLRALRLILFLFAAGMPSLALSADRPNILFVLFDDLGYGQPPEYRAETTFRLPHFSRVIREGMRFTDAHSASAVCTPTRYGVLTGRYPSRIGQYGVCTTYSPPIIPTTRLTVASLLKQQGYHTACIGKWHLGWNWVDGKPGSEKRVPIGAKLTGGPNELGFDYFCGFTHARNFGTISEQDAVIAHVEAVENQPLMIDKAVSWLDAHAGEDEPFFLYFPMCPPHTPIVPSAEYLGKSGAEDRVKNDPKYGDWILQGDAMLGRLLDVLDAKGVADETLVIVASDNGAEGREYEPLRASKRSIYEGGHRVPFAVRWPGRVPAGSTCEVPICLNDFMATVAEILGTTLPPDAGEDSVSLLPLLRGSKTQPGRYAVVHQSHKGDLAIRRDNWKLVFLRNGQRELYNLRDDLSETRDVAGENPEVVASLVERMESIVDRGRSTAGPPQENDAKIPLTGRPAKRKKKR